MDKESNIFYNLLKHLSDEQDDSIDFKTFLSGFVA
jgi:hypothetical protein